MADPTRSVARILPTAVPDGTPAENQRSDIYGEEINHILTATKHALAQEGSYFTVINPTPGTTVAFPVEATAVDDTHPFFLIANTAPANGRNIYLDYLKLMPTVAPASGTSARFAIKLDQVARTPTGGANPITPVNFNPLSPLAAQARVDVPTGGTALTIPAASGAARYVGNGVLRASIPVVLEEMFLQFGGESSGGGEPTAATHTGTFAGPVMVPPGWSAAIYIWFPSNAVTGLSAEYELAFWQR